VQGEGDAYVELNVSPSTEWAVYGFAGYRQAGPVPDVAPSIEVARGAEWLDVEARIKLGRGSMRVGLSAVVETSDGLTYWALAHPSSAPDFHRADGFVAHIESGT
jgi:hypothetical protein